MSEQHRSAMTLGQRLERRFELGLEMLVEVVFLEVVLRKIPMRDLRPTRPSPVLVQAAESDTPKQPGSERAAVALDPWRSAHQLHERLLHDILSCPPVADHSERKGDKVIDGRLVDGAEVVFRPGADAVDVSV